MPGSESNNPNKRIIVVEAKDPTSSLVQGEAAAKRAFPEESGFVDHIAAPDIN